MKDKIKLINTILISGYDNPAQVILDKLGYLELEQRLKEAEKLVKEARKIIVHAKWDYEHDASEWLEKTNKWEREE